MDVERERAKSFLIKHGLHESRYDFEVYAKDFAAEMRAGLAGQKSSLLMLPSYLGVRPAAPPEGDVIAIDAGGTNLRVALVRFAPDTEPAVVSQAKYRIPGSDGLIDKDEFFLRVADYIGNKTDTTDKVGFCFSFPCEIGEDRDGKIIDFCKEVKVGGSRGAYLGAELNAAFARAGKSPAQVTVLSDSAAALLGALAARGAYDMGGYICLIYGTGLNICYFDAEKNMLINTEAGIYTGFPQSVCDREIDGQSDLPGDHLFEKMVSGAYFSTVALKAARLAAREGLFSAGTNEAVSALEGLDAASLDAFMRADGGAETELGRLCAAEEDAAVLYAIFDGIYERAAKLLAIAVSAVLDRSGVSAARPALLVAEGSSFLKGFRVRERFERYIAAHTELGEAYELMLADGHTVIGAAASVFL